VSRISGIGKGEQMNKTTLKAILATAGMLVASPALAQSVGDTITGTLAFGSDGSNGGQYWNQNTITAPGAFTYSDVANTDTATFGTNSLTIMDDVSDLGANGFEMTFSDASEKFTGLTLLFENFDPGFSYHVSNGTIYLDWTGANTAGTRVATFNTTSTANTGGAVPEPATWAMMLLGFGMIGFGLRYRRTGAAKVSFA
jgi:hypothetical protein